MRKIITFFTTCLFLTGSLAFAQNGTIKGLVKTAAGSPAKFAQIKLKEQNLNTTTNAKGEYELSHIKPGRYTLIASQLGYVAATVNLSINEGEVLMLPSIILKENNRQLNEVIVSSNRHPRESETVSKMPLENLENPQIYNVVDKALMKEQMQVSYQEALNNIPGAMTTTVSGGNGGTYVKMRGFYATGGFRDGVPVIQYAGSDPVNIERIEAIKGPSGTLFGALASYGGLINRVSKKPYDTFGGEVSYSAGSNRLSRLTIDFNSPLNKENTVLFRLNGALHHEDSFQDYGYKRNLTIDPSFLFKVNERLTVTLNTEVYQSNWIGTYYNYNFPTGLTNIRDLPIGYKQSLIGNGLEGQINTFNNFAKAEYTIAPNWKSTTTFTTMQNRWQPFYSYGLTWIADSAYTRSVSKTERTTFNTVDIQQNFTGTFNVSGIKNRVLIGVDYYQYETQFGNYGSKAYDVIKLPSAGVPSLSSGKLDSLLYNAPLNASGSGQNTFSVYASDLINFTNRFMLMLSLRADRFHTQPSTSNGATNSSNVYTQTAYSPKFGLVYQPVEDQVSLFASYSNGFVNNGPVQQPDGTVSILKPEQANQAEGGIKAEAFEKKLSGSVSYFNILVDDKIRRDDLTGFQIQDGSQRNSGVELDLYANPLKGLNITAGYTYLHAKYEKVAASLVGKRPSTTPKNIANLWLSYKFTSGIGLALGGNYVGECFGNAANSFILPAYTVLNSSLFYEHGDFKLGLKVNNLGNTRYWDTNFYPQATRQFIGNITYSF